MVRAEEEEEEERTFLEGGGLHTGPSGPRQEVSLNQLEVSGPGQR